MRKKHNSALTHLAQNLRRQMTKEERDLWYNFLKDYPVKFKRQQVVGNYILDFYCAKANIAIELDGSQHYEKSNIEKDNIRSEFLESLNIKVIRIPNTEIQTNLEGVCLYIDEIVKGTLPPQAVPLP